MISFTRRISRPYSSAPTKKPISCLHLAPALPALVPLFHVRNPFVPRLPAAGRPPASAIHHYKRRAKPQIFSLILYQA